VDVREQQVLDARAEGPDRDERARLSCSILIMAEKFGKRSTARPKFSKLLRS
jgi:hypothetical protein